MLSVTAERQSEKKRDKHERCGSITGFITP